MHRQSIETGRSRLLLPLLVVALTCGTTRLGLTQEGRDLGDAVIGDAIPEAEVIDVAAEAETKEKAEPQEQPAEDRPKLRPLTVSSELVEGTILTGTLVDSTAISIKTAFGEAQIPLSEVAGIRFPSADDSSTTVVMLNGDSITGVTELKSVDVETSWGTAKINGQSIATMLFVPGLKWKPTETFGGKRWSLVEATSPAQPSPVQPASGTRSLSASGGTSVQGSARQSGSSSSALPSPNSAPIIFSR